MGLLNAWIGDNWWPVALGFACFPPLIILTCFIATLFPKRRQLQKAPTKASAPKQTNESRFE